MARTSTYLNFNGTTEAAFEFYKSVFGTEYAAPIMRMGDMPEMEGQPPMTDEQKRLITNIQLPITGGHVIMGTDAVESMGFTLNQGNNVYIAIGPDTRTEADELWAKLTDGGVIEFPIGEQFWGDYFGSLTDKFGTKWMVNTSAKS